MGYMDGSAPRGGCLCVSLCGCWNKGSQTQQLKTTQNCYLTALEVGAQQKPPGRGGAVFFLAAPRGTRSASPSSGGCRVAPSLAALWPTPWSPPSPLRVLAMPGGPPGGCRVAKGRCLATFIPLGLITNPSPGSEG